MVHYSPKAARAIGFLKKFYNDIEIFVEDTSSPNIHVFIYQRILAGRVRLTSVTALNGWKGVIDACKLDQSNDGRKKLYIIDGDLDLIAGKPKSKLRHLYRLQCYCVENMLLSEEAILRICMESDPRVGAQQAAQHLKFAAWLEQIRADLIALFVAYGIAHLKTPTLSTISFSIFRMCDVTSTGPIIRPRKVSQRIRGLYRQMIHEVALNVLVSARKVISGKLHGSSTDIRFISGKYLIALLHPKLHRGFGYRGRADQLATRLALDFDPKVEPLLARRLIAVASR